MRLAPLLAVLAIPLGAHAQPQEKQLPTFTQTADAPPPAPAAAPRTATAPEPAAGAAPASPSPPQPGPAATPPYPAQPALAMPPPYAPQPGPAATPPGPFPPPAPAPSARAPDGQSAPATPRKCAWQWLRSGFYLRMMTSAGYARSSGDGPAGTARIAGLGAGSLLAIGGGVGHGLVVAGTIQSSEVTAKFNGGPYDGATFTSGGDIVSVSDKARAVASQIGALVDWFPLQTEGLHVGLSAGLGTVALTNQADDSTIYGSSVAGTLFAGYDWPISSSWALGLALVMSGNARATLKKQNSDSNDETGYRLGSFFIGVAGSIMLF